MAPAPAVRVGSPPTALATAAPSIKAPSAVEVALASGTTALKQASSAPAIPIASSAEGCASGECLPELAEEAEAASVHALPATERWKAAVDAVRLNNPRLGKSLSYGRLVGLADGEARLAFPTDAGFHRATVFGHARAELESHLTKHLKGPTKLVEVKAESAWQQAPRSVAEQEADDKATRERAIEAKVRQNPAVLSVLKILGGSLEHVQVLDPPSRDESLPAAPEDDA